MKFILISSRFHPFTGGVENVVLNLAKRFKENNKVLVLASKMGPASEPSSTFEGVPVKRVWLNLPRSFLGFFAFPLRFVCSLVNLFKIIREFKPDLVNYHFPDDSSIYIYLARKFLEFPLVLNIHGNDLQVLGKNPWYRLFLKKLAQEAKTIIVHSNYIQSELEKEFPEISEKIEIIPNGVNEKFFRNIARGEGKKNYILFYGRLVPKKGVDVLIKAFDQIKRKSESDLLIVGDGEERKNLENLARKLELNDRVEFIGTKTGEPLLRLIREAQLAVIPSRREPFGIVALELAASGQAIIASKTGGLKELLEEEQTALFFENENHEDLAKKILMMENEPELRKRLSESARKEAQKYHWEEISKRYIEILQRAV